MAGLLVTAVEASKRDVCQLLHYETEPICWRIVPDYSSSDTLRPDLLLVVARGDMEWHWFVEVDLGTEHGPAIQRKCRQYLRYYQSGREQAERGIFPRVAWLTTTSDRVNRLRTLANDVTPDLPLFEVGLLSDSLPLLLPVEEKRP